LYQLMMNGTRLGLYSPIKDGLTKLTTTPLLSSSSSTNKTTAPPNVLINVVSGSASGVLAAVLGSPFFMMKVRLQVQSIQRAKAETTAAAVSATTNASTSAAAKAAAAANAAAALRSVGVQHEYKSALSGLWSIFQQEGLRGCYRGASAAMLRVGIGSGVQLSTYDTCKHQVLKSGLVSDGVLVHFMASLASGFLVTIAMNPADVLSTRLYNQSVDPRTGRGTMYNGVVVSFVKPSFIGEYNPNLVPFIIN
jgi:solute carrier family 25, member 34/35